MTRLSSSSTTYTPNQPQKPTNPIEYSAREVSPPALLLQQILRAHQIFLLHQSPSIGELWERTPRDKFCGFLKRFWDDFIWSWDVMLHGNPAVDVYNGLKLAAGGELGIGVGEEDWGSGEREVLEGFIGRTEGLVDLVVSRFGDAPPSKSKAPSTSSSAKPSAKDIGLDWQVSGGYPRPSDGVVFSGIGALSRSSVKAISSWTEWLHMHGQDAYGVRDNPSSAPRRKRRKIQSAHSEYNRPGKPAEGRKSPPPSQCSLAGDENSKADFSTQLSKIPPPIFVPEKRRSTQVTDPTFEDSERPIQTAQDGSTAALEDPASGTETLMKYLTLGVYGSAWGIPSGRPPALKNNLSSPGVNGNKPVEPHNFEKAQVQKQRLETPGYFLIGLQGDLEDNTHMIGDVQDVEPGSDRENGHEDGKSFNSRLVMRTVQVERTKSRPAPPGKYRDNDSGPIVEGYKDRLRVVVYIQQPFVFTFIFELQTEALVMPSFYRSLHYQLGPLQRPLLTSTSPSKVSERLWEAAAPRSTAPMDSFQPIRELVYDPVRLTVRTTIGNIPQPGPSHNAYSGSEDPPWTRLEALSVHSQILNTYISTRRHASQLETTAKTSRGFWVVWMRMPHTNSDQIVETNAWREAFLIRKASDYVPAAVKKSTGMFGRDVSGSSASGGWGPGKLAEGIGIDARQYIDSLLSLNR